MIFFKNIQPRNFRLSGKKFQIPKIIAVFLFFPLLLIVPVRPPSIPSVQEIPSCEIDLSYWGLEDPSEIGYLSVGVLHKESGEELVVYDIRKRKPLVQEPSKPGSRVPPFQGEVFLVDDFRQGSTNRLGGYFSPLVKAPSKSSLTVDRSVNGQRYLCFTYDRKSAGFSGFWIPLYDFKMTPLRRIFMDTSPFGYLTFDIRGEKGGEKLSLQVADHAWEMKEDFLEVGDIGQFLPEGKILKSWQRAWIPIRRFPHRIDRKTLGSLVFLARRGRGRVYIDNVGFTTQKDVPIPRSKKSKMQKPSPHRGMWVWKTKELLEDKDKQAQLARFSQTNGIT